MPILDVELVVKSDGNFPSGLTAKLADAAADICGSKTGELWVRLRALPAGQYAECGGGPSDDVMPVFVSVLMYRQPDVQERKKVASSLAARFASILERPTENIHVLFEPEGRERIAFGGKLVT